MYRSDESKVLYHQQPKNEAQVKILKNILLIMCKWKNKASTSQPLLEAREKQDEKLQNFMFMVPCIADLY